MGSPHGTNIGMGRVFTTAIVALCKPIAHGEDRSGHRLTRGNQISDLLNHSRRNTTMCWDARMMNPEAIIRSPTCAKILPKMFCPDC